MLRVWRGNRPTGRQWAARLEGVQDGERAPFTDLAVLLAHLRVLLDPEGACRPRPAGWRGAELSPRVGSR